MIFIIFPVPQNRLANFIAPSLVPRGRCFMAYSIPYQLSMSNTFLNILFLVVRKSLACDFPMWFLTTFDTKRDILRVPTMQFHPSLGKLLTGFQLLLNNKSRIFFATALHSQLVSSVVVSWSHFNSSSLFTTMSSHMMEILWVF